MIPLEIASNAAPLLAPIWQTGVTMNVDVGTSVRNVCRQIGIPDNYLDERIQTLFLNGKAIDDPDTTIVSDRAVLAFSAAMPGLAGATLRKGGSYASFRKVITEAAVSAAPTPPQRGSITLKLFNFISQELAPILLRYGILIGTDELLQLLNKTTNPFPEIRSMGVPLHSLQDLENATSGHEIVLLRLSN
uniref:Uncharacterized protein n=1 Tax=Desulfatirhabdium butyrativorans TaxID=340467 RepID=A0A7C4RPG8_9BACT